MVASLLGFPPCPVGRETKVFPVSGTLWLLPGHGFMLAPETGTFSGTFSLLTAKLEFWAVLFPSITQDLWCFNFLLPSEAALPRMAEATRRGDLDEPHSPMNQAAALFYGKLI